MLDFNHRPAFADRLNALVDESLVADNATRRPSLRTFLFKLNSHVCARRPCALPPPLQIGERIDPARARPLPFC